MAENYTQQALFDQPAAGADDALASMVWPDASRFPLNTSGRSVEQTVLLDLKQSRNPLIVAGFASLGTLVDFLADLGTTPETVRLLIGSEPSPGSETDSTTRVRPVPEEARDYWLGRGMSILQSPQLLNAVDMLRAGRLEARYLRSSRSRLHAKIYVGDGAVTIGSSNFTRPGMKSQWEANARFPVTEVRRYTEASQIAEHYWEAGDDFGADLLRLLIVLLKQVSWQEALARACGELLEGDWAREYLEAHRMPGDEPLWPSQQQGIAQALWVLETTGSVLIADATGAGKTRMGAHLLRAIADRNWRVGRVRGSHLVMIGPPSVERSWEREARLAGVNIDYHSHGRLSRTDGVDGHDHRDAVRRAQVLAVDEAHNFLNPGSNRTQVLLGNLADHTVLFTATPINRGTADLIRLADMIGADNLEDKTLQTFAKLLGGRQKPQALSEQQRETLRFELRRFTVRRTKRMLNELVDKEPEAYRDHSGRQCRYPRHDTHTYDLHETASDRGLAKEIRELTDQLRGIAFLRERIEIPEALRKEGWSDDKYLAARLLSASRLSGYQVMAALRSSRCALIEHIEGTAAAIKEFELVAAEKRSITGDLTGKLGRIAGAPPENGLSVPLPEWLADKDAHSAACNAEREIYLRIAGLARRISDRRDVAKVSLLRKLSVRRGAVLAFDSRPITLAYLRTRMGLIAPDLSSLLATGERAADRKEAQRRLGPKAAAEDIVAFCSDSMAEGLNLQRAAVIVHLDMPSVVRIAEQRIGRVDRMDSPNESIQAFWPKDAPEFALRSDERFVERYETVQALLGSNMPLPEGMLADRPDREVVVDPEKFAAEADQTEVEWDGIQDAFAPIRDLVEGEASLIERRVYDAYRGVTERVVSRVSVVRSTERWAFLCLAATETQAPRWVLAQGNHLYTRLDELAAGLRSRLTLSLESAPFTPGANRWLGEMLNTLAEKWRVTLPRRKQRALEEMGLILDRYFEDAAKAGLTDQAEELRRWADVASGRVAQTDLDLDAMANAWLSLVRPLWYERLTGRRKKIRPVQLKDIRADLMGPKRLPAEAVLEVLRDLPSLPPLDRRVAACILGVPD